MIAVITQSGGDVNADRFARGRQGEHLSSGFTVGNGRFALLAPGGDGAAERREVSSSRDTLEWLFDTIDPCRRGATVI